jgi:NDP-sugar pyrophosphorylase family protein
MPLFGEQAIIEHVLTGLARCKISRVTISLGYLGHLIEAVIEDGAKYGVQVDYARETFPLGTAGPLGLLGDIKPNDRILVINGDTYTDFDYRLVLDALDEGADAAVVCVERSLSSNYGVVHADHTGSLVRYEEKPSYPLTVSTGIYAMQGKVLESIPRDERFDMPDLLDVLVAAGRRVQCVVTDAEWRDLGRPEDFLSFRQDVETLASEQ